MTEVIVAGPRDLFDYDLVERTIDFVLSGNPDVVIFHGGANGVDADADKYARKRGLGFRVFEADWKKFGLSAGPKRNREMAQVAKMLIAIWNGNSRGTRNMIREARKRKLIVHVWRTDLNRFNTEEELNSI